MDDGQKKRILPSVCLLLYARWTARCVCLPPAQNVAAAAPASHALALGVADWMHCARAHAHVALRLPGRACDG